MKSSSWLLALMLALASGAAVAANQGFYLGAGAANAKAKGGALTNSSDVAYQLLAGYQFNKNFAAEGELLGLGKVEAAGAAYKSTAWGVAAIGLLPLNEKFAIYGKLGMAQTSTDTTPLAGSAIAKARTYKTSAAIGLGGQINVSENLGVRLSWDRYKLGVAAAGEMNLYGVTAVFMF